MELNEAGSSPEPLPLLLSYDMNTTKLRMEDAVSAAYFSFQTNHKAIIISMVLA